METFGIMSLGVMAVSGIGLVLFSAHILFKVYVWRQLMEHLTRPYDPLRDYKNPLGR